MRKFLYLFTFLIGIQFFVNAQEFKKLNYENSEIYLSGISLSDNWKTELNYNTILITNVDIKNKSNKNYRGLMLKLFLLPEGTDVSNGNFEGYLMTEANFKALDSKSSLIGVKIKSEVSDTPPNGIYHPALVLTNLSGRIMSFRVVGDLIKSDEGVLTIITPAKPAPDLDNPETKTETASADLQTGDTAKQNAASDPDSVVKITIADDHSLSLGNQWQVEINPKEFVVNIKGGDISNLTDKNIENLTLDVFLTEKRMDIVDKDFNGLRIASANIGDIESFKKFSGTQVKAGMLSIPQEGTYHILLTISATDQDGNQVVRTGKVFANPVSF